MKACYIGLCCIMASSASLADGWKISFTRDFSHSPNWSGRDQCVWSRGNYYPPWELAHNESGKRQVDCEVDQDNNAVCANNGEGEPRKGAYDLVTREIITTEIYRYQGVQQPVLYVFKVKLDEDKRPVSGTTQVNFGLFKDWPKGMAHDDVERRDLLATYCIANFSTNIGAATDPWGQSVDAQRANNVLIEISQKYVERRKNLNDGPPWDSPATK